jgi:hypothetical protein
MPYRLICGAQAEGEGRRTFDARRMFSICTRIAEDDYIRRDLH